MPEHRERTLDLKPENILIDQDGEFISMEFSPKHTHTFPIHYRSYQAH